MGFLCGIYSSAGEMTCVQYEDSLDHETQDAQSFASWDEDYLKCDNCFHQGRFGYPEASLNWYNMTWKALNAAGRLRSYVGDVDCPFLENFWRHLRFFQSI
jgi:alpha-galactosidase